MHLVISAMRVNIIGSGYIAQELSQYLAFSGHTVNLFSHRRLFAPNPNINFIPFPKSFETWESVLNHVCDFCFFLHSVPSSVFRSTPQTLMVPAVSHYLSCTQAFFDELTLRQAHVKLIYASSCSVPSSITMCPDLLEPSLLPSGYGLFKHLLELQLVTSSAQRASLILRISNPYGSSYVDYLPSSILNNMIRASWSSAPFEVSLPLEATRDFIHIDDLVKGLYASMLQWSPGIYSLGFGRSFSLSYLLSQFPFVGLPTPEYRFIQSDRPQLISSEVSVGAFTRLFSWQPSITLHRGILKTFQTM